MSDEECQSLSAEEELLSRHRREKKELQAQIQQLKKTVNKDKKKKKEVLETIEKLERDQKQRHSEELASIQEAETKVTAVSNGMAAVSLEAGEEESQGEELTKSPEDPQQEIKAVEKKISKAERRRQKKAEANREREARIKDEEKNNKYSARNVEAEKLKQLLCKRQLKMHEIEPDGNCMYAAIAHQAGSDTTITWLREQAEQFIRSNQSDFAPFITDPKTGEMLTPEQFSEYCDLIVKTPAWGGQPELRALSQVLRRRIEVLQAEGSPIVFGEDWTQEKTIHLAYYRHYYGLGEHYNSVVSLNPVETR